MSLLVLRPPCRCADSSWEVTPRAARRTSVGRILTLVGILILRTASLYCQQQPESAASTRGSSVQAFPARWDQVCNVARLRCDIGDSSAIPDDALFEPDEITREARSRFHATKMASLPDQQNPPAGQDQHEPSATEGSPKHIFLVVPAFHVAYQTTFKPLTPKEKFKEWLDGTYDPRGLGLYAAESATLEYSSKDGFCGYGKGWGGYGKCFASMEADANISSFFGDYLFPVIMHQDPRYFRLGQGSFSKRIGYAISRVFVTHADTGRTVFFASAISGTVLGAAASNLYYPAQDRGFRHSLDRAGLDLGNTALFNAAAEFWPDIKSKLHHLLGRH